MTLRMGIDSGSTATKGALVDSSGNIVARHSQPTGVDVAATAEETRSALLSMADAQDSPIPTIATGYGRARIRFADRRVTEITCHAAGVHHQHPEVRTILDIGGQDAKAIRLEEDGSVADFAMNDRCAAGTGSFLDALARRLDWDLDAPPEAPPSASAVPDISQTCVVFAESEVIGLLAEGHTRQEVIAAVHRSIASRMTILVGQLLLAEPICFTGGVARIDGLRLALEEVLGCSVRVADDPQFTGALGAALLASPPST